MDISRYGDLHVIAQLGAQDARVRSVGGRLFGLLIQIGTVLVIGGCLSSCFDKETLPEGKVIAGKGREDRTAIEITNITEGGFIISGTIGRTAAATKIDSSGNWVWDYKSEEMKRTNQQFLFPSFSSAVSMPDSTIFVCGGFPRDSSQYSSALIAHLNKDGLLLSGREVIPGEHSERGRARFDECIRWDKGVVAVGTIMEPLPTLGAIRTRTRYWIAAFDQNTDIAWERFFDSRPDYTVPIIGGTSVEAESCGIAFSITDNGSTEVFKIDSTGALQAHRIWKGNFRLVSEARGDEHLQLIGAESDRSESTLIELDQSLLEKRRTGGLTEAGFSVSRAFHPSGGDIVLAGSSFHEMGDHFRSAVAVIDVERSTYKVLELERPPLSDNGRLDAISPTNNKGEYVTARRVSQTKDANVVKGANSFAETGPVGISINFIQLR